MSEKIILKKGKTLTGRKIAICKNCDCIFTDVLNGDYLYSEVVMGVTECPNCGSGNLLVKDEFEEDIYE